MNSADEAPYCEYCGELVIKHKHGCNREQPTCTDGMSWPDTLRWLAEHENDDVEAIGPDGGAVVWTKLTAVKGFTYRLATRKPRVGEIIIDGKPPSTHTTVRAVELIPGMVVLERMPTEKEVIDAWNKHRQGRDTLILLDNLRVDIDE